MTPYFMLKPAVPDDELARKTKAGFNVPKRGGPADPVQPVSARATTFFRNGAPSVVFPSSGSFEYMRQQRRHIVDREDDVCTELAGHPCRKLVCDLPPSGR